MNKIRAIKELNKKEIEQGISPNASWHVDYRDTAYIYFGGLPYELSEGDVITIFSQFGEPVFLKLARDAETGKSKGFGWLKYEDQRSTDLAVDNLGGADIGGRLVSVDHARYKARDDEDPEEGKVGWEDLRRRAEREADDGDVAMGEAGSGADTDREEELRRVRRPMLKEERELEDLMEGHDEDDPMKEFLIDKKKEEVDEALRREKKRLEREKRHRSGGSGRHHRSHRSKRDGSEDEEDRRRPRRRREDEGRSRRDDTLIKKEVEEDGSHSRRRDSRDRGSRRDDDRKRDRDRDGRDMRRDPESDRRRRDRDRGESENLDRPRHRDQDRRRRDQSRSP